MITFEVHNTLTLVKGGFLPDHIRRLVSFYTSKERYLKWNNPNIPVKPVSLYNIRRNTIFTGCLPLVLKECNFQYRIVDKRSRPADLEKLKEIEPPDFLRDYQREAFVHALKYERGIIEHVPGTGKTFIITGFASIPIPKVILVPKIEILEQTERRINELTPYVKIGIAHGKMKKDIHSDTLLATYNTFYNLIATGNLEATKYQMVVVDETHRIGWENNLFRAICACTEAFFRFGLTGTASRESGDFLAVVAALGPIISRYTYKEAREHGYVADVKLFIVRPQVPLGLFRFIPANEYAYLYEKAIVENSLRNEIISYIAAYCVQQGRKTLVITRRILHGEKLLELIRSKVRSVLQWPEGEVCSRIAFTYGKDPDRQIKREQLGDGTISCLVASSIFEEGIDISDIDAIVNAAGEKSKRATIQRIGRGIREKPHGGDVWVFDFLDTHHPKLLQHSRKRIQKYKEQGFLNIKEIEFPYNFFNKEVSHGAI